MKGIILAGGRGTRLSPLTTAISKQLLPVYNKPMIYYPLHTLKLMGIVEILIIVSDYVQLALFEKQLGNGSQFGLSLEYKVQPEPGGLPQAFILGEEFLSYTDDVTLILGDNVFIANGAINPQPNTIYTYNVNNPSQYGVVVTDKTDRIKEIVEKPTELVSNRAVVGLYTFTHEAVTIAKGLNPSARGELEIVDLISELDYTEGVNVEPLNGFWFDCGNPDDLLECANLVKAIEHRTNTIVGLHE